VQEHSPFFKLFLRNTSKEKKSFGGTWIPQQASRISSEPEQGNRPACRCAQSKINMTIHGLIQWGNWNSVVDEPKPSACLAAMGRIHLGRVGTDKLRMRDHERLRGR